MTWIIRGDPKPFSAQFSARIRIRSIKGLARNSSGSTSGKSGLVKPISILLCVVQPVVGSLAGCVDGLWSVSAGHGQPLPQTGFGDLADRILGKLIKHRDLRGARSLARRKM